MVVVAADTNDQGFETATCRALLTLFAPGLGSSRPFHLWASRRVMGGREETRRLGFIRSDESVL